MPYTSLSGYADSEGPDHHVKNYFDSAYNLK